MTAESSGACSEGTVARDSAHPEMSSRNSTLRYGRADSRLAREAVLTRNWDIALALLVTWASFALSWPVALTLFLLLGTASLRGRYTHLRLLVLVLASPFVAVPAVAVALGARDYAQGTPSLRKCGHGNFESWNLDPDVRIFWSRQTCDGPSAHSVFFNHPHNASLKFLVTLVGPLAESFQGQYPSLDTAIRALDRRGEDAQLVDGIVRWSQGAVVPRGPLKARLFGGTGSHSTIDVRVYHHRDETLIIDNAPVIGLIDSASGTVYAVYLRSAPARTD
jgi:hypothetical protein